MSWPTDGLARFTVAGCPADPRNTGGDPRAFGYVYDRGRCHAIVAVHRHKSQAAAVMAAGKAAVILNTGGTLTPVQRGERPHGRRRYQSEGCRCDVCREAKNAENRASRARRRAAA